MLTIDQIQTILSKEIEKIQFTDTPRGLYEPIEYIFSLGGKRLRPALALLACDLFDGDVQQVINPAIGVEMFHNFTLLHDDIMDKADVRRGYATVHKKWDENTAILSGDAMQILAYKYIGAVDEKNLPRVLGAFSKMALEICEGQQYDVDFETIDEVSEDDYLKMICLKTAVLLGTALKIGAWIGGASDEDAEALYEFGVNIGIAFQLTDDLLDVYGDEKDFGKKIGGDILSNKKTYLLIQAQKLSQGKDAERLAYCLHSLQEPEEKIKAVTEIYNRLGVREICEERCRFFYHKSMENLKKLSVSEEKTIELRNLAEKMHIRKD